MATRVEQEDFACTCIKKDLFLNSAIIGQWNFDRLFCGNCYSNGIPIATDTDVRMLYLKCRDGPNDRFCVGKKPAEMRFERAYLA
jgi:hypothetical protein